MFEKDLKMALKKKKRKQNPPSPYLARRPTPSPRPAPTLSLSRSPPRLEKGRSPVEARVSASSLSMYDKPAPRPLSLTHEPHRSASPLLSPTSRHPVGLLPKRNTGAESQNPRDCLRGAHA